MELPFFGHKEKEPTDAVSTAVMERTTGDVEAETASEAAFENLEPHAETTEAGAPVTELPAAEPAAEEEPQAPVDPSHQISA
jgi:hypothetical protein